jgi:hypothetical protein
MDAGKDGLEGELSLMDVSNTVESLSCKLEITLQHSGGEFQYKRKLIWAADERG